MLEGNREPGITGAKRHTDIFVTTQVFRLKTKSFQPIYLRPIFYDGQANGLTLAVSWLVFWCFSSARVASIRLSLALS
jgi:hypothetical protein